MNTQYSKLDPQRIGDCLKQGALQRIVEKAQFLMLLTEHLVAVLEPEFKAHCQVMNIEGSTLTIAAHNAAWATRLRYESRNILVLLKKRVPELAGVTVINVRVLL